MYKLFLVAFLVFNTEFEQTAKETKSKPKPKISKKERVKKEQELRAALNEIRGAISEYKRNCEAGKVSILDRVVDDNCYPTSLEILNEGIYFVGEKKATIFLPRIPIDPMTGKAEWAIRSEKQENRTDIWDGRPIVQVYSKSKDRAVDGTKYRDW